jgi:dTDP-4-amino-4,6-dideoxygalactose transaminase
LRPGDGTSKVDELAIFSGAPRFSEPLHVGRPNIGDRKALFARMEDMFDRRWLSNHGRYVRELERRVEELLGVRHCIAVCNGTVALEIAYRAAGLSGEVIVPSFTFVATAHALSWQGIAPVFCDVTLHRHSIDPARVEELVTPRTTGIVGVHLWGMPCDVDALAEIARRHDLALLFDAAHAFASTHRGVYVGNFGAAEVFSFHATKFLNAFEGGAVVTNDDELARRVRAMSDFGYVDQDSVDYVGTNGKMSEASAAMALTGLDSIDEFVAANRRNHERYGEGLAGIEGLALVPYDAGEENNYQYVVVEVDEGRFGMSRDRLLEVLRAENVLARRYFFPGCHRLEPYRSASPEVGSRLPNTERLVSSVLTLPTGTTMTSEAADVVCDLIRTVHEHAERIERLLGPPEPIDC